MLPDQVRERILAAVCGDKWLFDRLVLKGGNALALIYRIGQRASLDLNFSIEGDFEDIEKAGTLLKQAMINEFEPSGLHVFGFRFEVKPSVSVDYWWGGYRCTFKLIPTELAERLSFNDNDMSRQALVTDAVSQRRKFTLEISKYEFFIAETRPVGDGQDRIKVYSPALLAAEKLRALLQQHPDYPVISPATKRSRGRDVYDIWVISDALALDLGSHYEYVLAVFNAKRVDMDLLSRFNEVRSLHEASWSDVEASVGDAIEPFEFYFNFVKDVADRLHALWVIDSP
ncbi:MAG: nucleotidyl transferase AbiEii/AbiGii toxin family protein [Candidatus Sabulitectum sp.]|nr:nucleotidyl transferase AbiEii/AbiGii toxin family protein [Candidatus Sabulitectum sp.]